MKSKRKTFFSLTFKKRTLWVTLISFAALSFFLLAAFFHRDSRLDSYVDNLPENESLNATPHNYELYVKRMGALHEKGDCAAVLNEIVSYYNVFGESNRGGTWIFYYAHLCFSELQKKDQLQDFVSKLKKKDLMTLGILSASAEDKKKPRYSYDGYFMQELMKSHSDYFLELSLADDYFLEQLLDKKKAGKDKINVFVDYAKRFPNSARLRNYIDGSEYEALKKLIPKNKLEDFEKIAKRIKESQFSKKDSMNYSFIKERSFAILKNTKEGLFFRNLYNFEGWEIVKVLGESDALDENGVKKKWSEVVLGGMQGFVETEKLLPYDKKSRAEDLFKAEAILLNNGNLLEGLDIAASLMGSSDSLMKERAIVLFYYYNKKIKNRATSKNNPYLDYALKYSKYFQATDNADYLEMSPVLFNYFSSLYPQSPLRELLLKEDFDF